MPVPHRSARLVAWSNAVALRAGLPRPRRRRGGRPATRRTGSSGCRRRPRLDAGAARQVRRSGRRRPRLALPVPGDPVGLPGHGSGARCLRSRRARSPCSPTSPTARVRCRHRARGAWGLVPAVEETGVRWTAYRTAGSTPTNGATSLADADRGLAAVAARGDRGAGPARRRRAGPTRTPTTSRRCGQDGSTATGWLPATPTAPPRCSSRARRLRTIVRLASRGDGGTLTAAAADAQRGRRRLAPLDRAARPRRDGGLQRGGRLAGRRRRRDARSWSR